MEKVVEVEVIREIVVPATPSAPTPRSKPVLFATYGPSSYTAAAALGFSEGIEVELRPLSNDGTIPVGLENHRGVVLVSAAPSYEALAQVRALVEEGQRAAIILRYCDSEVQENMRSAFGVSCSQRGTEVRGGGQQISPLFNGLLMEVSPGVEFSPGPLGNDECVAAAAAKDDSGSVCTAVFGTAGSGQYIFLNIATNGEGGPWIFNRAIEFVDNREAVLRLLNWVIEDPTARAQPTQEPSGARTFDPASLLARFSTSDPAEGEERAAAATEIIKQSLTGSLTPESLNRILSSGN